ncbi:MAG TPA: transcriptional regulator [Candidatus Omnitrophica bacterium]|nr:transcriptional regulator [Candidatus Omnitrophota bacterium]HCI44806.1 transcriptional regulator [Candidatus Omnitrophota bacterium]
MKPDIKLKIGMRIKELRDKRKMTQEELAASAEIDYKYLQKIEGKTPPNLKVETIEKLARALGTSPDKLLIS